MKRIVLFLMPIWISVCCYAEQQYNLANTEYSIEGYNDFDCNLLFVNDKEYSIELNSQETDDIIFVRLLSFGHYYLDNNELLLVDENQGINLKFEVDNHVLQVTKGFAFMLNKRFIYIGNIYDNSLPINDDEISKKRAIEIRKQYNQINPIDFSIDYGAYFSHDYKLIVLEDNTYQLFCMNYLLAQGRWLRNHNIIQLYDPMLSQTYYVLVGEGNLQSALLPGDYGAGKHPLILCKSPLQSEIFEEKKAESQSIVPYSNKGFGCSRK